MDAFLEHPFWEWLTLAAVAIGLVAALAFVVRYQYVAGWSRWRQPNGKANLFGRFLMIRKLLLSVLFGVVLLNRVAPGWHAQKVVTALLMTAFALHTFVPYRLLTEAQRAQKEKEAPHGTGR
jgi:D-alanyl-lipoteichoic acid acyltransferase DltB (MBOAT superfamily)